MLHGQDQLRLDLDKVQQKNLAKGTLTDHETELLAFQRYVRVDENTPEDRRLSLLQDGQEEVLCDLFAESSGGSGLPPIQQELLLRYFGGVQTHLEETNWNRPDRRIEWLRTLIGRGAGE